MKNKNGALTEAQDTRDVLSIEASISALRTEEAMLKDRLKSIKFDIEGALKIAQQNLDKIREESRLASEKVRLETEKLQASQNEFQGILEIFNKEKSDFEKERTTMMDKMADTNRLREKLTNFALFVRRESEKI